MKSHNELLLYSPITNVQLFAIKVIEVFSGRTVKVAVAAAPVNLVIVFDIFGYDLFGIGFV